MALFHFHVGQVKRSAGQSVIESAAYRAGEKLYSERYGEYSDYTRKGGVVHAEILLPPNAPREYADRQTLWNAVETAERGKNAQLAYSFDIALQNEFSLEENIVLARQFLQENFVSRGMIADFAVHRPDKDGGIPNPHFHVLCPIRPLNPDAPGARSSGERTVPTASLTPCQPRTGASLKRSKRGARPGRRCATRSLRKRACRAASIIVLTRGKALSKSRPSTRVSPCGRWKPAALPQTRASATVGYVPQTRC